MADRRPSLSEGFPGQTKERWAAAGNIEHRVCLSAQLGVSVTAHTVLTVNSATQDVRPSLLAIPLDLPP